MHVTPSVHPSSAAYTAALHASLTTLGAAVPLLTNLTIQDAVGKASNVTLANRSVRYAVGCDDTAFHANISRDALPSVHVSVNMEIFLRAGQRSPPSEIIDLPADPVEAEERAVCYATQGLPVGPSWELSFWYSQLTEEWPQMWRPAQSIA